MSAARSTLSRDRSASLNAISLFSGGMGLDLGLEQAGFAVRLAGDILPAAELTARLNRPDLPFFSGDVRQLDAEQVWRLSGVAPGQLDLLAGGPPCQSFSTAGKRLGLDDPERGPLVFDFVRMVDELRPRAFLMENVKGLFSASVSWRQLPYNNNGKVIDDLHGSLLRELTRRFTDLGYSLGVQELNSADYGVPQVRRRVFLVGFRDGDPVTWPQATHAESGGMFHAPWTTLGEAIAEVEDDSYCASFSPRKLKYIKLIPEGGNWRDLPVALQQESMGRAFFAKGGRSGYWRRLSRSLPAPTILTEPQNASTSLCHPTEDRPLTVRECARLQTFPDAWQFAGRGQDQYKLVGNAVPVQLARAVGEHLWQRLRAADLDEPVAV